MTIYDIIYGPTNPPDPARFSKREACRGFKKLCVALSIFISMALLITYLTPPGWCQIEIDQLKPQSVSRQSAQVETECVYHASRPLSMELCIAEQQAEAPTGFRALRVIFWYQNSNRKISGSLPCSHTGLQGHPRAFNGLFTAKRFDENDRRIGNIRFGSSARMRSEGSKPSTVRTWPYSFLLASAGPAIDLW